MSGPLFMRPYQPHVAHIIKMANESRGPSTPVPVTDDSELATPVKPSTIYMVRILIYKTASGGSSQTVFFPYCTSPVDFAALFNHRSVGDDASETWADVSAGDHYGHVIDTARFNTPTSFPATNQGARHVTGMIKTGSGGGTFAIKWGGGNNVTTFLAGSFLYLKEAQAY